MWKNNAFLATAVREEQGRFEKNYKHFSAKQFIIAAQFLLVSTIAEQFSP